jgi:thermitase
MKKLLTLALAGIVTVTIGLVASGALGGQAQEEPPTPLVPGQLLIGLSQGADANAVAASYGATVKAAIGNEGTFLLGVASGAERQAADALRRDSRVTFAEPNWVRRVDAPPDDGGFYLKWDLNNTGDPSICDGSDCPTADADIDWLEVWDALSGETFGSAVVAVLDTSVDFNHPDLAPKLVTGADCTSGTCGAETPDGYGHGTHVSGIAAGVTNNAAADGMEDTAGVAFPDIVDIMSVKVCTDTGSCPSSAIAAGIYYAADHGADVINMSLGGTSISAAEQTAINYAWGQGVLLVASAGNDNSSAQRYPAAYEPVMAVAATNWHDQKASYSSYGASWVDITAPGGEMSRYDDPGGIYSTMPTYDVYLTECITTGPIFLRRPCYDLHYDQLQGTSMSSPQVAGAAALLFAQDGTRTNAAVRALLQDNADPIAGTGTLWANGRLNLCKAAGLAGCDPVAEPTATPTDTPVPPTPTPTNTPSGDFVLDATGYKVRGLQKADLSWSGASGADVDVYRNGVLIATTANDGFYTDNINVRGGGTYTYQVCEAGTATCSNEDIVAFG